MKRRRFLGHVSRLVTGAAVAPPLLRLASGARAAAPPPPVLSVGKGGEYQKLVEKVLARLGGIESFVKRGDRVVVKPNIGWDRSPEQAGNTHPDVVEALIRLALDAGASQVSVFDRTCNEARRCYASSGIQEACRRIGDSRVRCSFIDDRKFVSVPIPRGKSIQEWDFYQDVLNSDCYINVPIAKDHGLARLTLGMKNIMGIIGGSRGRIHGNIGQRLADLNSAVRPALTVIDATRILTANGPRGGSLEDVERLDTVLASRDTVAADAYATTLFGLRPDDISSTVAGAAMGLGEMDLSRVEILKA